VGLPLFGRTLADRAQFSGGPEGILAVLKTYATLDGESPVAVLGRQAEERLRATQQCSARSDDGDWSGLFWPHEGESWRWSFAGRRTP